MTLPRAFSRPEGEEEITPPFNAKTRSFDSYNAAVVLQSSLQVASKEASGSNSEVSQTSSPCPGSPTVHAAAAALRNVHTQQDNMHNAVDCLMSLSSEASTYDSLPESTNKRKGHSLAPAPRRRLKMRQGPSPLAPKVRGANSPVKLLSGASIHQLKMLAAAYKLCPAPTAEQLQAIADRVGLPKSQLNTWFQSRKVLQDWVQQQPEMRPSDLVGMFYQGSAFIS